MSAETDAGEDVAPELEREARVALEGVLEHADDAPGGEQPGGASSSEAGAGMSSAELCTALLGVTFNHVIAPRRGAHWQLSDGEAKALGEAYGAVLDKYAPSVPAGPEATAVMTSLVVLGPRFMADAQQQQEKPTGATDDETQHEQAAGGGEFTTSTDAA